MISISARVGFALVLACSLSVSLRAAEPARVVDSGVARRITPEEVQRRRAAGEKAIVIDTRSSVGGVVVKGAVQVPNDRIEAWAKTARKDALIVAYCT